MATITHNLTLSTTDFNLVGDIKVRQADDETIVFDSKVLEHGLAKSFDGLKPFFCLMAREITGQGVSEEPVTVYDGTKGTLKYTLSANAMQMVGRNEAYFSFRKELTNGAWAEQFSTRSFFYTVEKSIYTQPFKDSNYWFTFKELHRLFNDYIESGKLTWEDFMDTESDLWKNFINQNREIIESVDPGGVVLTELIDARKPDGKTPYTSLSDRLNEQDKNMAEIENIVYCENEEDVTEKLQEALDKRGNVRLVSKGDVTVYISKTLVINSNTSLTLDNQITLKLASGTRNYMIINGDTTNGNENINLNGGTWDCNGDNNLPTGSYVLGKYPGHMIFFHKIKSLSMKNMILKNAKKYTTTLVDIENFIADNIGFDTPSDGLHFMPPLNNAVISNLYGSTNDDMISFTCGDYASYEVSNEGNFEDVRINNIICKDVKNCIKITGSGKESKYYFKNFVIDNISGTVTRQTIFVMDDSGDPSGATNLINTRVVDLIIKNITTTGNTNPNIWFSNSGGGDVTIEGISFNDNFGDCIRFSDVCILESIKIRDLKLKATSSNRFIIVEGKVNQVIINNVIADISNGFLLRIDGIVDVVMMSDVSVVNTTLAGYFIYLNVGSSVPKLIINNGYFKKVASLFSINTNALIKTNNVAYSECGSFAICGGYNIRFIGTNTSIDKTYTQSVQETTVLSINDKDMTARYTQLNGAKEGDWFNNTVDTSNDPTTPLKTGLTMYSQGKFKNL